MFIRVKISPNSPKKAVQIVESQRVGNKIKQRIIRHVGTALNDEELNRLKDLAEFIKASIEGERQPSLFPPQQMAQLAIDAQAKAKEESLPVDLKNLREEKRIIIGIHKVYGNLYYELGFDKVIPNYRRKQGAVNSLFHIVMGRLANATSKMDTVEQLDAHFGINLSLPAVYRMMDQIDDKAIARIQQCAWHAVQGLFPEPIQVIFYDCTTLYFESFVEDELKQYGFSKDMKFNQSQVLLAILVTSWGLPVGYEVFEGNKYEGHTLKEAISRIEKQFKIKDIIFVADGAMLNRDNLSLLEKLNKRYILGARIKNLPQSIQKEILNKESYQIIKQQPDISYSIKEIPYKGKRLIVTYSSVRAQKDAHDRQKAIERLLSKLEKNDNNPAQLISNFGYKKYLKIDGQTRLSIDEEKVQQAAMWDGLHGVITNDNLLSAEQIIEQYHGLWQVEETFRVSKHDLKVRPIFHWTPRRIKAHIAICFITLCLARHLQYRMKVLNKPMSVETIRRALMSVQISIVKDLTTQYLYGIPSAIIQDAKEIYQAAGIKISSVPYLISK